MGMIMTPQSTFARLATVFIALCFVLATGYGQTHKRVVVLPFQNLDGDIKYNLWKYELSDSLRALLQEMDPDEQHYHLIDPDSVEMAIGEFNLDPTNAQYESDVWRAVESLNASHVIQGNFLLRGDRVLINCYLYDVEFKISDRENQAKNIYKKPDSYMTAVPKIATAIHPGLTKQ